MPLNQHLLSWRVLFLDLCADISCENGGFCQVDSKGGEPYCSCPSQYTGPLCQIGKKDVISIKYLREVISPPISEFILDLCAGIDCTAAGDSGASCLISNGKSYCQCTSPYTGPNCEYGKCFRGNITKRIKFWYVSDIFFLRFVQWSWLYHSRQFCHLFCCGWKPNLLLFKFSIHWLSLWNR